MAEMIKNVRGATDILGDKWSPEIICCISNHNCLRFCRIQTEVKGINPRTLSARLKLLENHGVIIRKQQTETSRCDYALTKKGNDLIPILRDMQKWSEKYSQKPTLIG